MAASPAAMAALTAAQREAMAELGRLIDALEDEKLQDTYKVMHLGDADTVLARFLAAREYDVARAYKMLTDCLKWRVENDIDNILSRPVLGDKYVKLRASQLYGLSGYDKEGRPILCVRVGLSNQEPSCKIEEYIHSHIQHNEYRDRVLLPEASRRKGSPVTTCVKIYDMSGLRLAQLTRMQMHSAVAKVDDLNYPEKAEVYYVVNAPSVFSTCWKAVRPLLQERTRRKVRVLQGNGADELLQDMEESALPHFVRYAPKEGLGSSRNLLTLNNHPALLADPALDCCSPLHAYHAAMQQHLLAQNQLRLSALGGAASSSGVSSREVPLMASGRDGGGGGVGVEEEDGVEGKVEAAAVVEAAREALAATMLSSSSDVSESSVLSPSTSVRSLAGEAASTGGQRGRLETGGVVSVSTSAQ